MIFAIVIILLICVVYWWFKSPVVSMDNIDGFYKYGEIYYQLQKKDELGNFSLSITTPSFDADGVIQNSSKNLGQSDCVYTNGKLSINLNGQKNMASFKNNSLIFDETLITWIKVPSILDKVVGTYTFAGNKILVKKSTNGRIVVSSDGLTYKILHIENGKLELNGVAGVLFSDRIVWVNNTEWIRRRY